MKERILIVEDEVLIREMLKEIFFPIFQNVYTAENGESGLKLFNEIDPDLIITDIKMKKMDGLTMINEIQKIKDIQKFIVITAYSDDEHLQKVRSLGIESILIKPIDCSNLIELIREMLSNA
jgi:YesN/AraC family two-component response regulator